MKAIAVIGANWGDEGKGLLTDYFSDDETLVVRFNGGAQAGHTVVFRDKIDLTVRHVFRHFGSGTLRGARTLLSRFFINNPILFFKELEEIKALGYLPRVHVDPDGLVTTPWDMMINQIVEETRGSTRHGSCGVGINETIKRSEYPGLKMTVADLKREANVRMICRYIMDIWVPHRLHELNLDPSEEWKERLSSEGIMEHYISLCNDYYNLDNRTVRGERSLSAIVDLYDIKKIVFEGAQGLLLDEDHYFFPHVTHSHTGLKNIMTLATEAGIEEMDVVYATRAYATRHGAGPFPREQDWLRYEDKTNVANDWQGSIRFGHLDLDLLAELIKNDMSFAKMPVRLGLAITCLDQIESMGVYWERDGFHIRERSEMVYQIFEKINAEIRLTSYGPTAADIVEVEVVPA